MNFVIIKSLILTVFLSLQIYANSGNGGGEPNKRELAEIIFEYRYRSILENLREVTTQEAVDSNERQMRSLVSKNLSPVSFQLSDSNRLLITKPAQKQLEVNSRLWEQMNDSSKEKLSLTIERIAMTLLVK